MSDDLQLKDASSRDDATTRATRPSVGLLLLGLVAAGVAVLMLDQPLLVVAPLALAAGCWVAWRVVNGFEFLVLVLLATRPLVDLSARYGGVVRELPSLLGMSLIAGSAMWLWLNRRSMEDAPPSPLRVSAGFVVFAAAVATIASPEPLLSAVDTLRLAGGLVMLVIVARLVEAGTPPVRLLAAGAVAATGALLFPLVGAVVGMGVTHIKDDSVALRSSFFLSNNLAHFLVPVIVVATGIAMRTRGRPRLVAAGVALLAVAELGLTATRGAWFAGFVGLFVVGLLLERRLLAITVIGAVAAALFVPAVNARLVDLLPDSEPRTESSLTWRFNQWDDALEGLSASPVVGIGPGTVREESGKEPHSEWVRFLVELGGLGLLAWTCLVASMATVAWRARRLVTPGSVEDGFTAGVIATVAAFIVATFGENLVLTTSYSWYLMLLLGIVDAWAGRAGTPHEPRLVQSDGTLAWHG